jgi:hypothetical protein
MRATAERPRAVDRSGDAALRRAIARAVAYADVFDYPLERTEIHRYLIGEVATQEKIDAALERDEMLATCVERTGDRFHLHGRAEIVATRRRREAASAALWPTAFAYGTWIARLPLVRFVGVTGALAMSNADPRADIDLFILTHPGRLWLCRLLVLAVVRFASLRGHRLCPNFLLSTDSLALSERNLFTAHEIAQIVPLRATIWYPRFLEANGWTSDHLPNALSSRVEATHADGVLSRLATTLLSGPLFGPLERWEMRRKIRRLTARVAREGGSVAFSASECRGHFAAHDVRALAAYAERVAVLEARLG